MSFLTDALYIGLRLLLFAVGAIFFAAIMSPINTDFQASDLTNESKAIMNDYVSSVPASIDWIMLMLYVGIPLIAFGLAFVNAIPQVFFWIAALISFLLSLLGFIIQDIYEIVTDSGILATAATSYPVIDFVFSNFGFYFLAIVALLAVGSYVKVYNPFSFGGGSGGAMP